MQQLSKLTLPTFFAMSLDFIPIQASAVPSESVFSSSAETDTKKTKPHQPSTDGGASNAEVRTQAVSS
jgi:hypothetical protein